MMDYKYIEQLLERYWQCQTTLNEEEILRAFFAQDDVPVELLQYRPLFTAEQEEQSIKLSEDFDKHIMAIINNEKPVKARTITLSQRLSPLYRAAAIVAIIVTLGTAAQKAFEPSDAPYPTNYAARPVANEGPSVAVNDSLKADSTNVSAATETVIVK